MDTLERDVQEKREQMRPGEPHLAAESLSSLASRREKLPPFRDSHPPNSWETTAVHMCRGSDSEKSTQCRAHDPINYRCMAMTRAGEHTCQFATRPKVFRHPLVNTRSSHESLYSVNSSPPAPPILSPFTTGFCAPAPPISSSLTTGCCACREDLTFGVTPELCREALTIGVTPELCAGRRFDQRMETGSGDKMRVFEREFRSHRTFRRVDSMRRLNGDCCCCPRQCMSNIAGTQFLNSPRKFGVAEMLVPHDNI